MSEAQIMLGTSGWSYKEWEGKFYKKGERRKLRAYTHVFKTAEIDSTFYRNPSKGVVMGWNRYTPPDFVFTAKLPQLITHKKRLGLKGDVKSDLDEFLDLMLPLQQNGKLACLLIQLPPKYSFNPNNLQAFFGLLDQRFQYAAEFRNITWLRDETFELLKDHNVAYTIVDEPLLPGEAHVTADFAYFRWHGRGKNIWFDYNYSKEELDSWVPKVKEAASKTKRIYGYFNNHFHGYAPENCQYMLEKLGLSVAGKPRYSQVSSSKQIGLGDFLKTQ